MSVIDENEELRQALGVFYRRNVDRLDRYVFQPQDLRVVTEIQHLGTTTRREEYVPPKRKFNPQQVFKHPIQITSVTPDTGAEDGGTNVAIKGFGFVPMATVQFIGDGGPVEQMVTDVNEDGTEVDVTTVAGTGLVDVQVTNPSGENTKKTDAFIYKKGPVIESIDPDNGLIDGGTGFTIHGANFENPIGGSGIIVKFDGVLATSTMASTDGTMIFGYTPAHAAGAVDVYVENPDGQHDTLEDGYVYGTADVTHINFDPNVIPLGPVFLITIHACKSDNYADVDFTYNGSMTILEYFLGSGLVAATIPYIGGDIKFDSGVGTMQIQGAATIDFSLYSFQMLLNDSVNDLTIISQIITFTNPSS